MPIIQSAKKRMRQTEKRRELNIATKKAYRTSIKTLVASLDGKDKAAIAENLRLAQSALDTAVKKNVLHKNTASRKKAALTAKAKAAGATVVVSKKTVTKPVTKPSAKKPAPKKTTAKKA